MGRGLASRCIATSSLGPNLVQERLQQRRAGRGRLPEHEDDSRRAEDTGTGELNP
jgi:hypothetical protein